MPEHTTGKYIPKFEETIHMTNLIGMVSLMASLVVNNSHENSNDLSLQTGLYSISETPTKIEKYCAKEENTYYLISDPIVALPHFKAISVQKERSGSYALIVKFDDAGAEILSEKSTNAVGKRWGFVVSDVLWSVATVYSPITGGSLQLSTGSDTKDDLKSIANKIETELHEIRKS